MGCGGSTTHKAEDTAPRPTTRTTPWEGKQPVYTPPRGFPGPGLLAQCQREFAQLDTSELMRTDTDGLPLPFPPKSMKTDIFVSMEYEYIHENFKPTEEHLLLLVGPMSAAVNYLRELGQDDIGFLYTAFTWVVWAANSLHDLDLQQFTLSPDSVLYRIVLAREQYGAYNSILFDLCKWYGLRLKFVPGKAKHVQEKHLVVTRETTWLAVLLQGFWWLIDLDFAVRVAGRQTNEDVTRLLVSPRRPRTLALTGRAMAEFYFLTDPEEFIFSHFPDDEMWQMLARPVSREDFMDMANLTEAFFLAGFKNVEAARSNLTHDDSNPLEVQLQVKPDNRVRLSFDLVKVKGKKTSAVTKGIRYKDYCTLENDTNKKCLSIVIPDLGLFSLTLTCVDVREDIPNPRIIGRWFITSEYADFAMEPNPPNARDEFGIGAEMQSIGINIKELDIVDGIAHVQFESTEKFIEAIQTVTASNLRLSRLRPFYRFYVMNKTFGVIMKFPEPGKYLLKTFVKERGSIREFYNICTYLLYNKVACPDPTPFPPGFKNRVGYLIENEKSKLIPVSHLVPFFKVTEPKPLLIEMKSGTFFELNNKITVQTQTGVDDLSDYVWWSINNQGPESFTYMLQVRLPKAGMYCLDIRARPSEGEVFLDYFRYVFLVDTPAIPCSPFPHLCAGWSPYYTVDGHKDGFIVENTTVHFAFTIPEATDVNIYRQDSAKFSTLVREGGDKFSVEVAVGKAGQTLTVGARFINSRALFHLLQYKIVTDAEWRGMEVFSQTEAKQRQEFLRARFEEQRQKTQEDKAQQERREKQEQDEFDQHKNQLILENQQEYEAYQEYVEEEEHVLRVKTWGSLQPQEEERLLKKGIDHIIDEQNQELQRLRKIYQSMTKSMMGQQLQSATRIGHQSALRRYIDQYQARPASQQDQQRLKAAHKQLDMVNTRNALVEATRERDVDEMIRLIDEVTAKGYLKSLQYEVAEAQKLVDTLQHAEGLKYYVINIDKRFFSEIRSYQKPPEAVHLVMQAVLLLLGDDEEATAEWNTCAKKALPQGPHGLMRRIGIFNICTVHPEIRARAKEILTSLEYKSFQRSSAGASSFYIWALGTIEDYESTLKEDGNEDQVKPASIARQKEILRKTPMNQV